MAQRPETQRTEAERVVSSARKTGQRVGTGKERIEGGLVKVGEERKASSADEAAGEEDAKKAREPAYERPYQGQAQNNQGCLRQSLCL